MILQKQIHFCIGSELIIFSCPSFVDTCIPTVRDICERMGGSGDGVGVHRRDNKTWSPSNNSGMVYIGLGFWWVTYNCLEYLLQLFNTLIFTLGLIWSEIKQLWDVGLQEYVSDVWNVLDFITNSLYVATIALRIVAHYQARLLNWKIMKTKLDVNKFWYFRSNEKPQWESWLRHKVVKTGMHGIQCW